MSDILNASSNCILESGQSKKRWHLAFTAIYCSSAFRLLINSKPKVPPLSIEFQRLENEVVLDVIDEQRATCFSKVSGSGLSSLVKERNVEEFSKLGGVDGICSALRTDQQGGISDHDEQDVAARKVAFGTNTYPKPKSKGFFEFVWEAFKDPKILILMVCAALSLGFGIKEHGHEKGWYDGGSIFVAVFIVIGVSAISHFRQSRQLDEHSKVSSNILTEVVRGGRRQEISIFEIVVGDIICLKIGDQVPADGLFVEGHSLEIDESSMTGESDHVEINSENNPFLISGTKVADGFGTMVVTSVGMNTAWGKMMSEISRDSNEETPLQAKLDQLTLVIYKVVLAVAILELVVLRVRRTGANDVVNAVVGILAATMTIAVLAVPKGIPLALKLCHENLMDRMKADNALALKLSACETMGLVTAICTHKTGILTLNKMEVTKFWAGRECVGLDRDYTSVPRNIIELFQQGIGLNTSGSVYMTESNNQLEFSGSPTEKAILSWAVMHLSMDMDAVKTDCSILLVEAFISEKKRSGVLIKKAKGGKTEVHWKGAAELILAMCSHFHDSEGNIKPLGDGERLEFSGIIEGTAASSLICLGFAHRTIVSGEATNELPETGLILLGLVGLKDPCRPGVKNAVEDFHNAGVGVKMITGDNIFTAKAIATECGILQPQDSNDGSVVEGFEFRNYTEVERMEKVDNIRVMARSSLLDKLLMVQCLRKKGHVVAVTGGGTNDTPALKEADIGLCMGIQGTEVAKESSDIVILDDNFSSVATLLGRGRCVYNNIQKFIQFQLTVNVAALVINFVVVVSAGEVPLTAVQLLWVNLIMDTLGALALATDRPTKELMEKRPVSRTEPLISNIMWRNLLIQACYQIAVLLVLQFRGESIFNISKSVNNTMIFNTFVMCQVFNEFNARQLEKKNVFEGVLQNRLFMGIIGITVVLQVVMVEFLKKFADTERLNWGQWGVCIGLGILSWPIGWVVKCIPVPDKPINS